MAQTADCDKTSSSMAVGIVDRRHGCCGGRRCDTVGAAVIQWAWLSATRDYSRHGCCGSRRCAPAPCGHAIEAPDRRATTRHMIRDGLEPDGYDCWRHARSMKTAPGVVGWSSINPSARTGMREMGRGRLRCWWSSRVERIATADGRRDHFQMSRMRCAIYTADSIRILPVLVELGTCTTLNTSK